MRNAVPVMRIPAQFAQFERTLSRLAFELPRIDAERPLEVSLEVRRPARMVGVVAQAVRFARLTDGIGRVAPSVVVAVLGVIGAPVARRLVMALLMTAVVPMLDAFLPGQDLGSGRRACLGLEA